MIHLKTKKEFKVPTKRGNKDGIIYLIIDKLEFDRNNITAKGYYYYKDENDAVVVLDYVNKTFQWETITEIEENMLNPLESVISLRANAFQRLSEFIWVILTQESGENYETIVEDWEQIIE